MTPVFGNLAQIIQDLTITLHPYLLIFYQQASLSFDYISWKFSKPITFLYMMGNCNLVIALCYEHHIKVDEIDNLTITNICQVKKKRKKLKRTTKDNCWLIIYSELSWHHAVLFPCNSLCVGNCLQYGSVLVFSIKTCETKIRTDQ